MKPVVIIAIAFVLIVPLSVFAQEPSFDEKLANSEKYTKLIEQVSELEKQKKDEFGQTIQMIAGIATAGAFIFLGYQTVLYRSEKNHTLRAWVGELNSQLEIFSYINVKNEEKNHEEMLKMTQQELQQFNWTKIIRAIIVKNYGPITATNVKVRSKISIGKKPDPSEISTLDYHTKGTVLLPNSTSAMTFSFSRQQEDDIVNPNTETYFIFEISYKSSNSKKERKKGMLAQLHPTRYEIIENWD